MTKPSSPERIAKFPMLDGGRPLISVDFDDTLAEHSGTYDHYKVGPPRKHALWGLQVLKNNGCDIIIFSTRSNVPLLEDWVETYASGLVDHFNHHPDHPWMWSGSGKPFADIFIDDRDMLFMGTPVDWLVVIKRLHMAGIIKEIVPDWPEGVDPTSINQNKGRI